MRSIDQLKQVNPEIKDVSQRQLRTDGGTQYRDGINDETMSEYLDAMKDGAVFPPIETVFDGQHYWVVDGFHRLAALSRLGRPAITVSCISGSQKEAQLLALGVNAKHGLPRNHNTKRKIGEAALSHPSLNGLSIPEIAKHTGLSAPFLYSLRDPEVKARQQQARDRAVLNRIKPEVRNPIISDNEDMAEPHHVDKLGVAANLGESTGFSDDGATPSQEEIAASEEAFRADQNMLYKILESDDALKVVFEENKRLNFLMAQLELRLHGLMNERNACVKLLKASQKKCDSQQHVLKKLSPIRTDIALTAEVAARGDLAESMRPKFDGR
jgi:hypothetical protein